MEKIETLEAALKRIAELESENEELREELEYYKKRKMSGRQKHNAKWMAIYNDFVAGYESGMTMVEIANRNNVSERTIYRYKAYYDELKDKNEMESKQTIEVEDDEVKNLVKDTIHANGIDIGIYTQDFENEFISLTDIARYKSDEPKDVIKNWMRSKDTIEFLGLWEKLHNSNFKGVEFDSFRNQAGSNAFTMSPTKWIETTGAIGIVSKSGRYGGTFAHSDIAFEFASWISAEFKLYIIKDYKRLKADENSRFSLNWNLNREISKLNYRIHTDAIKEKLIPPELTPAQISFTYANEADMLNVVLFGRTAKQWKDENPDIKSNMRDGATLNQLLILANLESYNAVLIHQGKNQKERMELLRQLALQQIRTLESISTDKLPRLRQIHIIKTSLGDKDEENKRLHIYSCIYGYLG